MIAVGTSRPEGQGRDIVLPEPRAGEVVSRCGLGGRDAATVDKEATEGRKGKKHTDIY